MCDTKIGVEEIWPWVCHVRTRTALKVMNDTSGVFGPILWPWPSVRRIFEEITYIWPFFLAMGYDCVSSLRNHRVSEHTSFWGSPRQCVFLGLAECLNFSIGTDRSELGRLALI